MIDLDQYKKSGSIVLIVMAFVAIIISGIYFGLLYFTFESIDTALRTTDCVITDNVLVGSCQELFDLAVYPFLALREILVFISFFVIFGLILGMLFTGYQSGKSPVMLGLFVLITIGLTYMGVEVSNIYRTLLENPIFRSMMLDFKVYNRVMMGLPWFVFITGFFSFMLSLVNYQKTKTNVASSDELDY